MTPSEIKAAVAADSSLQALRAAGNFAAIAAALPPVLLPSIPVDDVFDVLFPLGDWTVMKQAQLSGDATAVMAFETLRDAKELGPGTVNLESPATTALLDALQAASLLSQTGRDALMDRRPRVPHAWEDVESALEGE